MRYNLSLLLFGWMVCLVAVLLPTQVLGKPAGGGGRGGGGGSSGGGRGGSSSSSGGRSTGSSSPSSGTRGGAPPPYSPGGSPPAYSPGRSSPGGFKGGSIPRISPGSSIGSGYRSSGGASVPRTFGGAYSPASRSGYLGSGPYRSRPYWIAIIPFYAWAGSSLYNGGYYGPYCGFHCRYYSRYNDQEGKYYARVVDPIATNATTGAVSIATVRNTDAASDNRMQWVFSNGTIRSIYYDTSDPGVAQTQPADFTYGMTLYQMVEYVDTDANGFYSPGDAVARSVDLRTGWSSLVLGEKASADGRNYLEGTIQLSAPPITVNGTANATAAGTTNSTTPAAAATFALTIRSSNVLINDTASGITVLPNSVGLDLAMTNYALAAPTNKLALITLLSSAEDFGQDPDLNLANDGNVTKGVQFGDKAGGRIEWFTTTPGGGSTTGSRVVFPLPSPLPAPGPDDARVTAGRAETAYVQAININPATAAAPIRVSMISFLDEQVLTPDASASDGVRTRVGMVLVVVSAFFALSYQL